MATGIYHRGSGQYLVRIRQNGRNLNRTFETHEEARQWREVTVGAITGRTYVDRDREQRTTLAQVLAQYRDEVTPAKDGARQERNRLLAWEAENFAALPIISVTTSHIVAWRKRRLSEGKAPTTINNALNLLSAVFKRAIGEWEYKVTNPCLGISRIQGRAPREVELSMRDEEALLAACGEGPQWLVHMVKLALTTAMRQGEIRRLEWKHIHADHIHLPKVKDTRKAREVRARDVPLTSEAAEVVSGLREALPRRLDGWVFGDPNAPADEGGITEWMVQQAYADAVRKAMANKSCVLSHHLTFHDLRHVSITRLKPLHTDMLDLSVTTGHKTLTVLKRYYNPAISKRTAEIRERERQRGKT